MPSSRSRRRSKVYERKINGCNFPRSRSRRMRKIYSVPWERFIVFILSFNFQLTVTEIILTVGPMANV